MKTNNYTVMLTVALLVVMSVPGAFAQGGPSQTEGWQGPRPTPQPRSLAPAPQPSAPSGRQMLEIPSSPQPSAPGLPLQPTVVPPRPQPEEKRPTQLLTVTVTDQQGRYVLGLKPEDFSVYEDDAPQKITYFNTGQDEPVSLGLIVDMSGSMLNKTTAARRALRRLVNTIRPRDEVFLVAFNQRPILLQDFTDSRALLLQATSLLQPQGGTALYDALLDGLRRVQKGHCQKKAVVVITDGLDVASVASRDQTLEAIQRSGVLVYTIGVGNPDAGSRAVGMGPAMGPFMGHGGRGPLTAGRGGGVDETVDARTLRELSAETGGKHFLLNTADVVGSTAVLDEATQAVSDELRQQYSLGYNSPLKGDVYRGVRVETRQGGLIVRTRKGVG